MHFSLQDLAADIRTDALLADLDCYIVGGAVRDCLLGQAVKDKDWVVVGATAEQLSALGFLPVGADFPVFLHPHSKEEFALARTERKKGRGYHGFVFYAGTEVSLEDDLARRDLTINAMAVGRDGQLIDPFGGQQDIEAQQLRHVGASFVEDPVRLLRLARFLARYPNFSVADQTHQYAQELVDNGEVDALVAERVWLELHKGLMAVAPVRMFDFLQQLQALERVVPHLNWDATAREAVQCAVKRALDLPQRFALLLSQSQSLESLGRALRAPRECIDYAVGLRRLQAALQPFMQLKGVFDALRQPTMPVKAKKVDSFKVATTATGAEQGKPLQPTATQQELLWASMWKVLEQADALRRPERFAALLDALACLQPVDKPLWLEALSAVQSIDAGAIAQAHQKDPKQIPIAIAQARQRALAGYFSCST